MNEVKLFKYTAQDIFTGEITQSRWTSRTLKEVASRYGIKYNILKVEDKVVTLKEEKKDEQDNK